MDSNKLNFNFGDVIIIKQTAPLNYKPGSKGCICGVRTIDSKEVAIQFNQAIGSDLYLIEFDDGKSLEIPSNFLFKEE